MSRSRKRRPKADHRRIVAVLCGLLGVAAAALAFAVEHYGGQGVLPTWGQLYDMLGVADNAPDAEIVASGQTSVTFLDVGQGDSVLICQDGEFCLIDAGTPDSADSLVAALRAAGVDELAYLVMTHPHADHIGGMPQVLESFDTGLLILPDLTEYDEESAGLDRTLAAAADNGVPMYVALDGDTFTLGGGTLTVLQAGEQPQNEEDAIDANNLSLCLRYTAGSFAFVDTGDAEADLEEQLVSRCGAGLQADLLKAGHHGSNTSNTQAFLDAISPQVVVASCGLDNDYGHPHAEVVERVLAAGADFYRTDQDGAVTAVYDQNGLQIHRTADDSGALAPAA